MRIPLAVNLESRDGGVGKDAKVLNGIVESRGQDIPPTLYKRPGLADQGLIAAGQAQLLYNWNGIKAIIGDVLYSGTVSTVVSSPSSSDLAHSVALNPSDKSANLTLSNNNLTATATSGSWQSVRGVSGTGKSTGKWFWEVTYTGNGDDLAGIGNSSAALTSFAGSDGNGWGLEQSSGSVWHSGSATAFTTALSAGEVVGFALDMGAGTLQIYRASALVGTAATGLTGTIFPMVSPQNSAGETCTVNFGASSFTNALPSGFAAFQSAYTTGLSYSAVETNPNAATPYLFFKTSRQGWTVNRSGTVAAVTYASSMGAGTYTLTSLTRSGTTATATLSDDVFSIGDSVTIAGASPVAYNGTVTVTATTSGTPAQTIPLTITRASGSTTATAVTTSGQPHGLTSGAAYTISGATQTAYNGSFTITSVDAVTFTFTVSTSSLAIPLSITRSGTTATATSSTPHNLTSGTYTLSGAAETEYNGSKSITVTSPTTFTYTVTVTPFPSPATGSPVLANQSWTFSHNVNIVNNGTTASANTGGINHSAVTGNTVTISGSISGLNGTYAITVTGPTTFTFTSSGVPNGQIENSLTGVFTATAPAVSSVTWAANVATVTTATAHLFNSAHTTAISGASPSAYNKTFFPSITGSNTFTYSVFATDSPTSPATGSPVITDTAGNPTTPATGAPIVTIPLVNPTFSYAVAGSPTTPATGTITAAGGGGTVPGCPYIDGYISVMDANGVIWHCAQDNPTSWPALTFLTARNENGGGKALAKSLNYLVAFKEYSTEYYYDAQNQSGSPFSPVDNGFTRTGCASGASVARVSNSHCWISQIKEGNRSVHRMDGLQQQEIATPDICRILNADTLATVYAFGIDLKGHPLYLLTLPGSNITLVYDLMSKFWTQWTSLTLGSQVSVSSITLSGTTATVTTSTAHGLNDGDPVKISGAAQSAYNGIFQAFVLTTTTFTIQTTAGTTSPATGTIIMKPYTETYFKFIKETTYNGSVYFLHETDGHLYQMLPTLYQDAGIPIDLFARTVRLDGGDDDQKKMRKVRFIGDLATDIAGIRFSDSDSGTFSAYRLIALDQQPSEIRKCGGFRRRSVEFRHVGNTPLRGEALELEIAK